MEEKYKKQSIERFNFISEDYLNKLKRDNVKTLGQLSNKSRKDLKDYGFELLGLGLKG